MNAVWWTAERRKQNEVEVNPGKEMLEPCFGRNVLEIHLKFMKVKNYKLVCFT